MFKLILALFVLVSSESTFRVLVADSMVISDCIDTSAQRLHDTFQELNATYDDRMHWIARITKKCVQHATMRGAIQPNNALVGIPDYEHLIRLCGSDLECIFTFLKEQERTS